MNIVTNIKEWQDIRKKIVGKSIGFVPTMGNLHVGHISLCQRSTSENDITIASIFVNPTQFNEASDFERYPRTLEQDQAMLAAANVDYVLVPDPKEMYPDAYQVQVNETNLSVDLEGAHRPGHFMGMLTVVMKLLNLAQATRAYFGEKDYQQYLLVKKMVAALFIPTDIIPCPTVRAEDGLPHSSRNSRLTPAQRELAVHFPRHLMSSLAPEKVAETLTELGFTVEYIAEKWGRRLGAVRLGEIRLLDNLEK